MPQILVANEKGLFGETSWKALITELGFEALEAALPALEAADPALFKTASDFHSLCASLPQREAFIGRPDKNDLAPGELSCGPVAPDRPYGYARRPARCWLSVGKFIGKSSSNPPEAAGCTPEALGWIAAEAIFKREAEFSSLAKRLGIAQPDVYGAKGIVKKSAAWTIEERSPFERLASAESFAIYLPQSRGFLNDKGSSAPLGGARLFESAEAASRTITSRQLASSGAVVAAVSARVVGLDPVRAVTVDLGPLTGALAHEEARQLREALGAASIEILRQRLAELEAAQPAAEAPAKVSAPRKRL